MKTVAGRFLILPIILILPIVAAAAAQ